MTRNNLVRLKSGSEATATLIWLPHAGGSAAFFQELSNALPDSVECLAAEYPGRGRRIREPLCSDLMTMVREVAESIAILPEDRPVVVFGHSLGARVGFEVCRRLRSSGSTILPRLLAVSACEPLHLKRALPFLNRLPDGALLDMLLKMGEGVPSSGLAKEFLQANLRVIRSDLALEETHFFSPLPLSSQAISVYGGTEDNIVRHDVLAHWRMLSSGPTTFNNFEGGHFYILQRSAEFLARLHQDICSAVEGTPYSASP